MNFAYQDIRCQVFDILKLVSTYFFALKNLLFCQDSTLILIKYSKIFNQVLEQVNLLHLIK